MRIILLILGLFFAISNFAQTSNALVDAKIAKIPSNLCHSTADIADFVKSNFKSENDKIRAIFYWTASNISYDYKNSLSIDYNTTPQEKIKNVLETKKGVCSHYAAIFNDIANKAGIKSCVIEGYTKQYGVVATLSHAWCAAKIDGIWWLFDPTWGAGYIDKGNFVRKRNDFYCKVAPSKLIASHIPFDYLWQFLNYPVTNQEFIDGKTQINKAKSYYDFGVEIEKNEELSAVAKASDVLVRIEKNGVKNNLIREMVLFKKKELEMYRNNNAVDKLNLISAEYNEAIVLFNDFVFYRNKQFKPVLPDEVLKGMIETPKNKFLNCQNLIYTVGLLDPKNVPNVKALQKAIDEIILKVEEQEKFVKEYLSKGKGARRAMFTKVSWFGIPLN